MLSPGGAKTMSSLFTTAGTKTSIDSGEGTTIKVNSGELEILGDKVLYHHGSKTSEALHDLIDEPVTVRSKVSMSRPQTHRLPCIVIWSITILVPVLVAVVNYIIVLLEHLLKDTKFIYMQKHFTSDGAFVGAAVLASICALYAAVATCLTTWIGPMCAGSGLPEAKGYLNGNAMPLMFSRTNLLVRILGITLACAASFPVGREGPMVCIGGTIGFQIVEIVALPFVRRWVDVHTSGAESEINPALIVDEERFAHAKRVGCALGGAAGIACAFNAPIGGILYMFEEVTVTSWPPELTFRAFVCTVLGSLLAKGFLNLTRDDVHHLVIFDDSTSTVDSSWSWEDIPFFFVLAGFIGLYSAVFTRCMLYIWNLRDRFKKSMRFKRWKKEFKAAEAIIFAAVCAFAFALVPMFFECVEEPGFDSTGGRARGGRLLGGQSALRFVQHDCKKGEHREVATLLLTGAEEAVKHLFSRSWDSEMSLSSLALAITSYTVLACGMPGLPVPMGCFVPCLLIGAMLGRFMGEAARATDLVLAHPGVYALVGSAAMLSGFTHMTIAIVVLLVEAAADLSLVGPIMLGIFIATFASKLINHHAYDEVLILRKGVPFLDAEVPHEMDNDGSTAFDLCDEYPEDAILPLLAEASQVVHALDYANRRYDFFPVVENGRCVGLTTRTRLEATVTALRKSWTTLSHFSEEGNLLTRHLAEEDKALGIQTFVSGLAMSSRQPHFQNKLEHGDVVPVHRIMDRSPYTILEDMPAPRFYPLFIKAGVNAAAVISKSGNFLGVLTRSNLISQSRDAHLPQPIRKATADSFGSSASPTKGMSSNSIYSNRSGKQDQKDMALQEKERAIQSLKDEVAQLKADLAESKREPLVMEL